MTIFVRNRSSHQQYIKNFQVVRASIKHGEFYKIKKMTEGFPGQRMIKLPEKTIKELKKNPLTLPLYMTAIGFFPKAKNHFRERKTGSNDYILIYCVDGAGTIDIYNRKETLTPNSLYIIPPETPHKYQAINKNPWSIYWLLFRGTNAKDIYQRFTENKLPNVKDIPYEESKTLVFDNIIDVLKNGYVRDNLEYANMRLWQIFSSFLFHEQHEEGRNGNNNDDVVGEAIKYMQNNLDSKISIDDVAEQINYSGSHFYSLFKKGTGSSPLQYFTQLKIQKSREYLSFTNLSIKELSYKLGYEDPFYFSRLFKKSIGMSPVEYRNKYRHL